MRKHVNGFASYLEEVRNVSPFTLRSYTHDLTQFVAWVESESLIQPGKRTKGQGWENVTYLMLRRYLGHLTEQGYDRRSVVRKVSALKGFFRWLEREQFIIHNPAAQVAPPKTVNPVPDILDVEEIERLLALPDGETPFGLRDKALLELLYASGMRVAEAATLTLHDIDWRVGEARVQHQRPQAKNTAGNGQERLVPLGRCARLALHDYVAQARPQLIRRCKRDLVPTNALWINGRGTRLSTHAIYMLVLDYARRARIKKNVTPQTLRHSFAMHLLEGGADLQVVKELLGHRSLASTQLYMRLGKLNSSASRESA